MGEAHLPTTGLKSVTGVQTGREPMSSAFVFRWKSGQFIRGPSIETIAAVIICAAVGFNMVLAVLNVNLTVLDRNDVILVEAVIVGLALMVVVLSANRLMLPWGWCSLALGDDLLLLGLDAPVLRSETHT